MKKSIVIFIVLGFFSPTLLGEKDSFEELRFQEVVIFGDSYTDTGNVYKLTKQTWPLSPPYYHGRYCNGPNWVDMLGKCKVSNYAYGSATTDNNFVQGYTKFNTVSIPGIRQQIGIYFSKTDFKKVDFAKTLYIIWGGGNDFLFNRTLLPPSIVNSLLNGVRDLVGVGAKNILIFNQIPAQYIPLAQTIASSNVLASLTSYFNQVFTYNVGLLQNSYPQVSFNIFDINLLITKVINKNSYFTNTTANCWNAVDATTIIKLCSDPTKFVFLDQIHFTSRVHRVIADAIRQFLFVSFEVNTSGYYVHHA